MAADDDLSDDTSGPAERDSRWDELGLTPVEIALPRGVGLTLRHYGRGGAGGAAASGRTGGRGPAGDPGNGDPVDPAGSAHPADLDDVPADGDLDSEDLDSEDLDGADLDADLDQDGLDETADDEETDDEDTDDEDEVPVFLARGGTLLLFRSAEGLLSFAADHPGPGAGVDADADPREHDLAHLPGWQAFARAAAGEITADDVVPDDEDRYELDLVVDNLRGGHDAWEPDLLIGAGEIARDLGFALGLREVLAVLGPGSPLDDLDEAVRDGGFLARRRARRIGADQAALAWRSVIGKISSAVEWHD